MIFWCLAYDSLILGPHFIYFFHWWFTSVLGQSPKDKLNDKQKSSTHPQQTKWQKHRTCFWTSTLRAHDHVCLWVCHLANCFQGRLGAQQPCSVPLPSQVRPGQAQSETLTPLTKSVKLPQETSGSFSHAQGPSWCVSMSSAPLLLSAFGRQPHR